MQGGGERPWRVVPEGLTLRVRLTPKGGRDAIDGVERLADGTSVLRARVRAAPHDGEANEALCALLAKTFGVPVGRLRVLTGATSRIKTIGVAGDATALTKALEALEGRPAA